MVHLPTIATKKTAWLEGRTNWPACAASGSALVYAAYRAYYALGGTMGMFGTPVSMHQWRVINGVGAAIILLGAVLPIAILPLWSHPRARLVLLALCWTVAVGCIMHGFIDDIQRVLSLAGVLKMDFPFWATRNARESDLQDLFFNETWFLLEGLMWGALGCFELQSATVGAVGWQAARWASPCSRRWGC